MDAKENSFAQLLEVRLIAGLDTPIATLKWLKNSSQFNCFYFFTDIAGRNNGYISWANVNRETLLRLQRSGLFPVYFYEWDEGNIKLLLDIAFVDGWTSYNHSQLRQFLRSQKALAWYRHDQLQCVIRQNDLLRRIQVPEPKTISQKRQ